ncbi:hypothetical protein [Polycladomyces subterraneus]|uniref:50S ribosomal protein L35 n=1 Tax=Polycladomyces subterraneus TaxID=1016997 RepID=A0ABT8IJK9_9BACL|nr:hypothetical protein [Polycladomyces subterraneus]MDN4592924.1 hypothetical protein [Polycladomyces subterraneus]
MKLSSIMHRIFKQIPVHEKLANKPRSKRSVAVLQRGKSQKHRAFGDRTAHIIGKNGSVRKRTR